jgi:hypothetical protein
MLLHRRFCSRTVWLGIAAWLCILLWVACGLAQGPGSTTSKAVEADPASWKELSSREGGFAVKFPGTPRAETKSVGEFSLKIHRLTTFAEYSVMYADYPDWANDNDPRVAASILDNGLKGAVAEVNSKLLEVEEVSLDGHPGRRYKEKMPDGSILRGKTFLVGHRLYQIAVTTPAEENATGDERKFYQVVSNKFLESFRLIQP